MKKLIMTSITLFFKSNDDYGYNEHTAYNINGGNVYDKNGM